MSKKVYIGNLSYSTREETLQSLCEQYGTVLSAVVIKDRDTQQSKGFGFVEFADDAAAEKAIAVLNGKEVDGRRVRVNVAEEKQPRFANGSRDSDRGPRNFERGRRFNGAPQDFSDRY
ncbi:MAG: RNA-binding protein [Treponema sp.]|nr:RNA-binding protein [Treponema sp.]